ncbi:MAG: sigma-70 family RNA polymerase sigma factor [Pseudomonadota bacterium]
MSSDLNPLYRMAAQKGLLEVIRSYIDKGGDVNATDSKGVSLLHWARRGGNQELCALLLAAGAVELDGVSDDSRGVSKESEGLHPELGGAPESGASSGGATEESSVVSSDSEDASLDGWAAENELNGPAEASGVREQHAEFQWDEENSSAADDGSAEESGWVAEEDGEYLPSDEEFAARARATQERIASHLPLDDAADWNEVKIQKPPERKKLVNEAVSIAIDEQRVASLIARIEEYGRISLAQIESMAPIIEGEIDDVFVDVAKRLVAEKGGILEENPPRELFDQDELLFSILTSKTLEGMADEISFFDERYRGEKDALKIFSSQLRKYALLSPKEEIAAGKEISESLSEAVRTISRSKNLLRYFVGGFSVAKFDRGDEVNSDDGNMDEPGLSQEEVSETRDSGSLKLLGEVASILEEEGSEISDRNFSRVEENLFALGFGFSDAVRLLRTAEETNKLLPAVRALRRSVEIMVKKRNFLVERNLRLVAAVARRYSGNGCDLADLVQEGNIGLLRAAERWDYRLGYKFSTYAMWWIRQSISRAVQDSSRTIRIPVHVSEQMSACKREIRKYQGPPKGVVLDLVANAVGMSKVKLLKILSLELEMVSLEDVCVRDERDFLCTDMDVSESATIAEDVKRKVDAALSVLDERQREVIRLRFGIGDIEDMTLEQVGREFGVTRERIRQIERKALVRLSKGKEADFLRDLLGVVS